MYFKISLTFVEIVQSSIQNFYGKIFQLVCQLTGCRFNRGGKLMTNFWHCLIWSKLFELKSKAISKQLHQVSDRIVTTFWSESFKIFFLFFIWIFNLETQKAAGDRFSRRFIELLINSDALREYGTYAKVTLVQKEELESPIAVNMPLKLSMSNTGSEQIFIRTVHQRQH